MATQKELIAVVAENMGVSLATVTVVDRYLAEAGLRTHAKRGRGNTDMSYSDAANLIIATAWNVGLKDAVNLVSEFRRLPVNNPRSKEVPGDTFGEALEFALKFVAENESAFSAAYDASGHMSATVIMYEPERRAEINIESDGTTHQFEYRSMKSAPSTDLQKTVQFSQVTLGFVGKAIAHRVTTPA